jgi:hypothetical protein
VVLDTSKNISIYMGVCMSITFKLPYLLVSFVCLQYHIGLVDRSKPSVGDLFSNATS